MDPQREQQLAQAAQHLAGAVYHFLQQAAAACSSLNAALFAAQTTAPLPVHLPLIPVPPAALPLPDMFSTPVKQPPPKSVSFPHLDSSPLWSPMALFQASLQQHTLPLGGLAAAANGPTRSTARAGAGAARRGGHHSPLKQPPPLFDAGQQAQQAQQAGALHHWKSEVSANIAALSPLPNGLGGGLPPTAAADPISPRAAALMAACQEAEHAPPARLVRLTSNLSSAAEAMAGEAPGQGSQPLAKQRSDLADLALLAEEESRAAAAAAAAAATAAATAADAGAAVTPDAMPAVAPTSATLLPAAAEGGAPGQAAASPAGAGAPLAKAGDQQGAAKRSAEEAVPEEQAAAKRQRSSGGGNASGAEAAEQQPAQPVKQEAAEAAAA